MTLYNNDKILFNKSNYEIEQVLVKNYNEFQRIILNNSNCIEQIHVSNNDWNEL